MRIITAHAITKRRASFLFKIFSAQISGTKIDPPAILEKLAEGAQGHHGRVTSQSMTALCAPLCETQYPAASHRPRSAQSWAMPELTRRRYPERDDCWHVYFGDVHAGTIARRSGNPHDTEPWGVALRLLSRLAAGGMYQRHGGDLRSSPRRL